MTNPAVKLIPLPRVVSEPARDWRCGHCAKLLARVLVGPNEVTIIEVKAGALRLRLTVTPGALTEIACPRCEQNNVHRVA